LFTGGGATCQRKILRASSQVDVRYRSHSERSVERRVRMEGKEVSESFVEPYLLKTKRSPRSETLCWLLSNAELVRSGLPAADSSTINEKRTKTLAKNIAAISFINPSLRRASESWDQILKEQLTCPIRFCGQEMKRDAVSGLW
jgi:hypothetical protein